MKCEIVISEQEHLFGVRPDDEKTGTTPLHYSHLMNADLLHVQTACKIEYLMANSSGSLF